MKITKILRLSGSRFELGSPEYEAECKALNRDIRPVKGRDQSAFHYWCLPLPISYSSGRAVHC
jgi:hypothetical protein